MKKNDITAKKFYDNLKHKDKYKLVNGLFIVKYLNDDISEFVAEFHKVGSALNYRKKNLVSLNTNEFKQKFSRKYDMTQTNCHIWRKLGIKWIERPIEDIL